MFKKLLTMVVGDPNEREVKRLQPLIDEINDLEDEMRAKTDDEMVAQTESFRQRVIAETADARAAAQEAREIYVQETDLSEQQSLSLIHI